MGNHQRALTRACAGDSRRVYERVLPARVDAMAISRCDPNMQRTPVGVKPTLGTPGLGSARTFQLAITAWAVGATSPTAQTELAGTVPADLVYANHAGALHKRLAASRAGLLKTGTGHYVFWPDCRSLYLELPTHATMVVELTVDGHRERSVAYVACGVQARSTSRRGGVGALERKVKAFFHNQLKIKFAQRPNVNQADLVACRYDDMEGNAVILTFHVMPDTNRMHLVDVEFLAPALSVDAIVRGERALVRQVAPTENDRDYDYDAELEMGDALGGITLAQDYAFDPRDLDQVAALHMATQYALECAAAAPAGGGGEARDVAHGYDASRDALEKLRRVAPVIEAHYHAMHDTAPSQVAGLQDGEIEAAAQVAIAALYGTRDYWTNMAAAPLNQVRHDVRAMLQRMNHALRESRKAAVERAKARDRGGAKGALAGVWQYTKGAHYSSEVHRNMRKASDFAAALRRRVASSHMEGEKKVWEHLAELLEQAAAPAIVDVKDL